MKVDVQIAGLKELNAALMALPAELQKRAVYRSLLGGAKIVRDRAKELAPVVNGNHPMVQYGYRKPGTLKNAIRSQRSKIRQKPGRYEVIVRVKGLTGKSVVKFKQATGLSSRKNPDDPYYWWFVEFGTSKMAARPFLRPAFASTRDAQLAAIQKSMTNGIKDAARRLAKGPTKGRR